MQKLKNKKTVHIVVAEYKLFLTGVSLGMIMCIRSTRIAKVSFPSDIIESFYFKFEKLPELDPQKIGEAYADIKQGSIGPVF
jgi:hypothetical protein